MVGLPDASVAESCDRVRTALRQSGFSMPPRRVTINLAPGDLRKQGPRFDLAIALGILALAGILPLEKLSECLVVGELGLDGRVRPVSGILAATAQAKEQGLPRVIVPSACRQEACWVEGIEVVGVDSLLDAIDYFCGRPRTEAPCKAPCEFGAANADSLEWGLDLQTLVGQPQARRALEIAAAGGHHLLLIGPPGCGKTHLARCLPGLLPPLERGAALEVLRVRSALRGNEHTGFQFPQSLEEILVPPFQEPDVAATWAGLFGGELPGEVSRAHKGVLFLDEFLEFKRTCLETLRTVLDTRRVEIVRARRRLVYPADFILVAAMNPCPCGHYRDRHPTKSCSCSASRKQNYLAKLSGPIRDRIDLHLWISRPRHTDWFNEDRLEDTATVQKRVLRCRELQARRGMLNSQLDGSLLKALCPMQKSERAFLVQSAAQLSLSGRALHKVLRLARTIADLDNSEKIGQRHLLEAFGYRDPVEMSLAA